MRREEEESPHRPCEDIAIQGFNLFRSANETRPQTASKTLGVRMLTKDYAPGIESARREALGSTRPGKDYSHLRRFLHSELQHHLTKTTTVRQENFPFPVNVKTDLDVILRLFDARRTLPTIDMFTVIWDILGNTIDCICTQ